MLRRLVSYFTCVLIFWATPISDTSCAKPISNKPPKLLKLLRIEPVA